MAPLSQIFIEGLSRQAVDLRRFEDSAVRAVERVLRQAEKDIMADLAERSARRQLARPGSSITWREARMTEVLENVNATLATAYDKIETRVGKRLQDAAAFSFESTADVLDRGLAPLGGLATANTVAVGPELLERISRDAFVNIGDGAAVVGEWWASQEGKIRENIARSFRSGMLLGEGVPGLARRLQNASTGMPISRRWAEAVARTSVISAAEEARHQTYTANRHVIKGIYHYSTLDDRTTVICITYSGKGWLYTEDGRLEPSGHNLPFGSGVPRHVSCRSITLPWLKTWEEQGFDADELNPPLRRAFGDRATGPRGDLNAALKADPDLARKVLGKTRYDLWKSGRATLDDFVDARTGQPWKVAELKTMFADGGKPPIVKAKKGPKATVLPAKQIDRKAELDKLDRALVAGENVGNPELRREVKTEIQKDILARMKAAGSEIDADGVKEFIDQWARTSGDSSPESIAMQLAAKEEFKLAKVPLEHLDRQRQAEDLLGGSRKSSDGVDYSRKTLRTFLRAQYEATQEWLKKEGLENVTVARGAVYERGAIADGIGTLSLQPLSSFSSRLDVAQGFGTTVHIVRVPSSAVLSTSRTGAGCLQELEVIIAGGDVSGWSSTVHLPRGVDEAELLAEQLEEILEFLNRRR